MTHVTTLTFPPYRVEVLEIPPPNHTRKKSYLLLAFSRDYADRRSTAPVAMLAMSDGYVDDVETREVHRKQGAAAALLKAARKVNGGELPGVDTVTGSRDFVDHVVARGLAKRGTLSKS